MKKLTLLSILCLCTHLYTYAQWEVKYVDPDLNNTTLREIKFYDGSIGWAMGDEARMLKTTDQGETWELLDVDLTGNIYDFDFISQEEILMVKNDETNSGIYKSLNGGLSWEEKYSIEGGDLFSIQMINTAEGFVTGRNNIWKTENGGDSWTSIYTVDAANYELIDVYRIQMLNESIGYAVAFALKTDMVSMASLVLKTIDGGSTWQITEFEDEIFNTIHFLNEDVGFLGTISQTMKTTDAGETWNDLENSIAVVDMAFALPNQITTVCHPENYIAIAEHTEFAIGKSDDIGETWLNGATLSPGAHLETVFFQTDSIGFVAGDYSIIMKTETGGGDIIGDYPWDLFITATDNPLADKIQLSPNPTQGYITIQGLNDFNNWQYHIIDVTGGQYQSGYVSPQINIDALSAGTYILLLKNEDQIISKKVVKK